MKKETNPIVQKYTKMGIIAASVIAVAILGIFALSNFHKNLDTPAAISDVSENAAVASELRIAVISMDKIQTSAKVLEDLHKQRESFENKIGKRTKSN